MDPIPAQFPDLDGKVAVVTGGTKGIGRATCELLAANGCRVVVVARSEDAVTETVESLRADGGQADGLAADAADGQALARVRAHTESAFGPADILVPFAGGFEKFWTSWEIPLEEWEAVMRLNLTSTFLIAREFLPGMIERRRGACVLMASNAARSLDKMVTASYAASKAGVLMFMRHTAIEAGPYGVRLNAIAPATVTSERIERIMDDEAIAKTAALAPLGRMGTPEDCAAATAYLASDASGWLTGVTLDVAGGRVML